jgi:multiple sugar transport system permease protein
VNLGLVMAGATVSFLPIFLIFVLFQGYFAKGITAGAVRG